VTFWHGRAEGTGKKQTNGGGKGNGVGGRKGEGFGSSKKFSEWGRKVKTAKLVVAVQQRQKKTKRKRFVDGG